MTADVAHAVAAAFTEKLPNTVAIRQRCSLYLAVADAIGYLSLVVS